MGSLAAVACLDKLESIFPAFGSGDATLAVIVLDASQLKLHG